MQASSSGRRSPKDFVEAVLREAVLCQDDHGRDQAAKVYLPEAPQAPDPTKGFEAGTDCSEAAGMKLKKLQAVYSAPAVQALCPESVAEAEKAATIWLLSWPLTLQALLDKFLKAHCCTSCCWLCPC